MRSATLIGRKEVQVKRPWLLTQVGQRTSMLISIALSVVLLLALTLQNALVEAPRYVVTQIDRTEISECVVLECGRIEAIGGLESESIDVTAGQFVNTIRIEFVNHGRLVGEREIWLELRDSSGKWLEAGRTKLNLNPKGKTFVEFGFVQNVSAIRSGVLSLQY